jgi:hypothetical protein
MICCIARLINCDRQWRKLLLTRNAQYEKYLPLQMQSRDTLERSTRGFLVFFSQFYGTNGRAAEPRAASWRENAEFASN